MIGRIGQAFQKLLKDDRSAEEKERDQKQAELKAQRTHKVIDIDCYFIEINKLKQERLKLIKKGKGMEPEAREMTEHIAEGLKDLEAEIYQLLKLVNDLGEPTTEADSFKSRCSQLKIQEDTDGFESGGNISISMTRDGTSELQDLNAI